MEQTAALEINLFGEHLPSMAALRTLSRAINSSEANQLKFANQVATHQASTSANAVRVVNSLDTDTVLMVPDGNLARYTAQFTEKKIIPWKGFCYVHNDLLPDEVQRVKDEKTLAE